MGGEMMSYTDGSNRYSFANRKKKCQKQNLNPAILFPAQPKESFLQVRAGLRVAVLVARLWHDFSKRGETPGA